MVKPFEDALFSMKAGDVVGPIKSEFGYHVIQLREVKGGQGKSFEQVRDKLAAEQLKADADKAFADVSGKLVDQLYKNPTALEPAAKQVGLPVQTLGPFSRSDASGVAANPAVLRAAFSETLVQDGTVSDPINIAPNHSVVLRVTNHTAEQALLFGQGARQGDGGDPCGPCREGRRGCCRCLAGTRAEGETLQALAASEKLQVQPIPGLPRTAPIPTPAANRAIFQRAATDRR